MHMSFRGDIALKKLNFMTRNFQGFSYTFYMKNLILLSVLGLLTSCAMGPLAGHETARSVGDGRHELVGAYGTSSYAAKWNYGLSQNFDIGLHIESLSVGGRLKYALLNPRDGGFALAFAAGAGSSFGGSYYNGDLIVSTLNGRIEPYAMFRYNQVTTNERDFRDKDTGVLKLTIDEAIFSYGQVFVGTRIWITKDSALSLEASKLLEFQNAEFSDMILVSGALLVRF